MFYSSEILSIKSNSRLGIVWLAGTIGPKSNTAKKLGRRDLNNVSIQETCAYLISPPNPFSLRLSANLMIGVSRVYGQQCFYHMSDVQGLCSRLTHQISSNAPESIDLPQNEKKGTNISLNKIECISAVNFPTECDALNFSDLDLNSILSITLDHSKSNLRHQQFNVQSTPELGRFNPISSTSSSITPLNNRVGGSILQDSDFSNVIGSGLLDMNDGFDNMLQDYLPLRSNSISSSSNLEFQIPDEIKPNEATTAKTLSHKPRKLNLMDDSEHLMLSKDELFISVDKVLNRKILAFYSTDDPEKEAMKLLNNPSDLELVNEFGNILKIEQFHSPASASGILKQSKNNYYKNFMDQDMNDDYYDEVEVFRNDTNAASSFSANTPNMFQMLPWSMNSSSDNDNASSYLNTPIKKNNTSLNGPQQSFSNNDHSLSSTNTSPFKISDATSVNNETVNFLQYLQERIIDEGQKLKIKGTAKGSTNMIYLDKLIMDSASPNRHIVSRAFYHLLELKSSDLIELNQSKPFSSIKISIKVK